MPLRQLHPIRTVSATEESRPRDRWHVAVIVAVMIGALTVTTARAGGQSALQITRNGEQVLISKDVGAERWAITFDPDGGSITGNVLAPGGPAFVDCTMVAATLEELTFECFALTPCSDEPCGRDWTRLSEHVTLPFAFLLPAGAPPPQSIPTLCADIGGGWGLFIMDAPGGVLATGMSLEQNGCMFAAHDESGTLRFAGTIAGDVLKITTQSTQEPCPFTDRGAGHASSTVLDATFRRSFASGCATPSQEVALIATRDPR